MSKKLKLCLALILSLAVLAQYSFSPQALYAYGLDNTENAVQTEETVADEQNATEAAASTDATDPTEATKSAEENKASDDGNEADKQDVTYPAAKFSETAGDVKVNISAPEGALPEGTTVEVASVKTSKVQDAIDNLIDDGKIIKAVDITFKDKDGKEIEPNEKVSVTFESKAFGKLDDASVVHINNDGEAEKVKGSNVDGNKATFKSDEFSVYVIVETGADARVKVLFKKGTETIATMYVKEADTASADKLDDVLYDPGAGTLEAGVHFKGWATDASYTAATKPLSIADIRKSIEEDTDWDNVVDGDSTGGTVVEYYAMLFKQYEVTYEATTLNQDTGEEGTVTLGRDQVLYRADETTPPGLEYTVNMAYTPEDEDHDFKGWAVKSGAGNIVTPAGTEEGTVFENTTELTIKGDVVFTVSAPEGKWLVFDQNGKGATYTAPQFVLKGSNTSAPSGNEQARMKRNGYTFGGWYKDKECTDGKEFTFGNPLTEKTTIYAKWTPNATAPYTVIFWTQALNDEGKAADGVYEVAGSYVGTNGTVGENIPYTFVDNGSEDYVTGVGTDNGHYTGFCLTEASKGQEVEIKPEGDAVLNLYYDRIEYNFKFYLYRDGTQNNRYDYANNSGNGRELNNLVTWHSNQTQHPSVDSSKYTIQSETVGGRTYYYFVMKACYGEDISSKWPTYDDITGANNRVPVSYVMMVGTALKPNPSAGGDGTVKGVITVLNENILGATNNADGNYVIVRFPDNYYNWRYHIWFETVAGEDYSGKTTHNFNGKTYYEDTVMEVRSSNTTDANQNEPKYPGFTYITRLGQNQQGTWGGGHWRTNADGAWNPNGTYYHLNYIYDRETYKISYFDGNYVNASGTSDQNRSSSLLHESDPIEQGAAIPDAAKNYIPDLPDGQEGYVFEGWYLDEACTVPYAWGTMPVGGIKVYAKWRQIEYRVFLHPNVSADDASLDWGSDSQEMNFKRAYGDKVSVPVGTRTGYTFVGWFLDEDCTKVFNADAFILNETTVTEAYDKTKDFTDPMDKYGNGATYCKDDADHENRFWITKKFNLYGKWRANLTDADGIRVVYDKKGGTGEAEDDSLYVDGAKASAVPAVNAPTATQKFEYWVMQKWNKETGEYEDAKDSEGNILKVYPGQSFDVLAANAKVQDEGTGKNTYTVQLRAEYTAAENVTPTHICWFKNDGTKAFHTDTIKEGETYTASTLVINDAVDIQPAPELTGHEFLGWARVVINGPVDEYYANESNWTQDLGKNDLFLHYNKADQKFYTDSAFTKEAKKVAADEITPYHAMFAVWKVAEYDVTVTKEYSIVDSLPDDFAINYTDGEDEPAYSGSVELTLVDGVYTGTVESIPYGTELTFTETNYEVDGYSVTEESTAKADDTATPGTSEVTMTVGEENTVTFINTYKKLTPELTITKEANTKKYSTVGQPISWTITATNSGNVTLNNVVVTEELNGVKLDNAEDSDVTATIDGLTATVASLEPGKKLVLTATYEVTQKDLDAGSVKNSVKADSDKTDPPEDPTTSEIPADQKPGLTVTKTANPSSGVTAGTVITYTVVVKNTGNVTVSDINLVDAKMTTSVEPFTLAAGESKTITYTYTVTEADVTAGSVQNSATATGKDPNGEPVEHTDSTTTSTTEPTPPTPPTPTPTPTPTPGGGGTPGVGPAPAPAAPAAVIADNPAPTTINDTPAPKAVTAYWALINLLCAIATALLSLIMLIRYFGKRTYEEEVMDPATGERVTRDVDEQRKGLARIASLIPAIGGIIAFILTEDMSLPMTMVDKWTVLMVVILAIQAGVGIFAKLRDKDEEEEDDEAMA